MAGKPYRYLDAASRARGFDSFYQKTAANGVAAANGSPKGLPKPNDDPVSDANMSSKGDLLDEDNGDGKAEKGSVGRPENRERPKDGPKKDANGSALLKISERIANGSTDPDATLLKLKGLGVTTALPSGRPKGASAGTATAVDPTSAVSGGMAGKVSVSRPLACSINLLP